MNKRMCYVCRQWININKLNGLHVKTIYTKTKIVEHIRRLLAADNPISVSENASICLQCLHKFNQYDLACTTVERVQAELRRDLLSSEGIESKEDVIESVQSVRAGKGDGFLGNSRYQKEPGNRIGAAVCLAQEIMDESLDNGEIKQESSELRTRADPENNPVDGTLIAGKFAQRTENDWRKQHQLQAWLETIDGNEKEVRCKFCKTEVLALERFLIRHGQSRSHILKMSARKDKCSIGGSKTMRSFESMVHVEPEVKLKEERKQPTTKNIECSIAPMENTQHLHQVKKVEGLPACQHCHRSFVNKAELMIHVQEFHELKPCGVCGETFEIHSDLSNHLTAVHGMGKFVCYICTRNMSSSVRLRNHILGHQSHDEKMTSPRTQERHPYLCDLCHHKAENLTDLQTHVALHDNIFKCAICDKLLMRKANLILHMRLHTGDESSQEIIVETNEYECNICGKKLKSAHNLSQHAATHQTAKIIRSETGQTSFRCDLCGQVEQNAAEMQAHIVLHGNMFKCSHCDKVTKFKASLISHMKLHHQCDKCGEKFNNEILLQVHWDAAHSRAETSDHICHICGKILKSAGILSRHIRSHPTGRLIIPETGRHIFRCDLCHHEEQNEMDLQTHIALHENKLKCVICGKMVTKNESLIMHMRVHSDKTYYQCDKCGKEFIHRSSLKTHLATTHTVERKYPCDHCSMAFKTSSCLKKHMMKHTGEKNSKCPECGKCFASSSNMRAHQRLHLGISRNSKKHECVICNLAFEKPSQLDQHCHRIHSRVTSDEIEMDVGV